MGCIYFIRHKGQEPIKIGLTNEDSPEKRIRSMETVSPWGIELIGHFYTSIHYDMEKIIHDDFASRRLKGEWFNISPEDVEETIEKYSNISLEDFITKTKIAKPRTHNLLESQKTESSEVWVAWKCQNFKIDPITNKKRWGCGKHNIGYLNPRKLNNKAIYGMCRFCHSEMAEKMGISQPLATQSIYYREDIVFMSKDKSLVKEKLSHLNGEDWRDW